MKQLLATSPAKSRGLLAMAASCFALAFAVGAALQPPTNQPLPRTLPALNDRLGALVPTNPEQYLLLAEELGAEATDRPSRDLSRHLYTLAFELYRTRAQPSDGEFARSACIGLASLTANESERRWLVAIGDQVAPATDKLVSAASRLPPAVPESTSFNLASAMGLARAGEGRRAESYLNKEGVRELLAATQTTISGGRANGQGEVLKWVTEWPVCPTCKNRRIVTRASESAICGYCDGNPGPRLSDAELIGQYRAESLLLRGTYRSWSAQLLADGGEPLRDPNPTEVAASFGIDPRATLWRNGMWTAP